jgi:acyl-coenzyme A synthetase/AMP-(fatty) acid ligase
VSDAPIPISRLLATGRAPEYPVAIDDGGLVDWETFGSQVSGLQEVLAARRPGRWVIFTENAHAFAVSLLATWHAGAVAVLAPNGQRGTLASLSRQAHGVISDQAIPDVLHLEPLAARSTNFHAWPQIDRQRILLELQTSGSTGVPKLVSKSLANLEDEVAELEQRWGALVDGRQIFGTVSHQHIYGLLFRVLWPLSAGRLFRSQTYVQADELAARMAAADGSALVSSPAHLRRLKASVAFKAAAERCGTVFSSGGALDRATALALRDVLGVAPVEIFGSTETGGVAWRSQDGTDEALGWTPFDSVSIDRGSGAGRLRLRSPFVNSPEGEFTMADRVEFLDDGRFVLGGRDDRTVKVGDKRLSLPDMEAALREHPYAGEVALVVLDGDPRERLGAVIVPTRAGRTALARIGRRDTSRALLEVLEPYWDRVLLPKVWRYVNRIPEDAQGKVTAADVSVLFASPFDPAVTAPELVTESIGERRQEQTLRVPETLAWLDGHFGELAVVPGVAQVQWAVDAGRALAGHEIVVERIEALKFKDLLRPGDVFHLLTELSDHHDRLTFRLWNGRGLFSSGRCILAATDAAVP